MAKRRLLFVSWNPSGSAVVTLNGVPGELIVVSFRENSYRLVLGGKRMAKVTFKPEDDIWMASPANGYGHCNRLDLIQIVQTFLARNPVSARLPGSTWAISAHAIEQYRERFGPDLDTEEIQEKLENASNYAVEVGKRKDGKYLYASSPLPQVGFVISRDQARLGKPTLVTVLDLPSDA